MASAVTHFVVGASLALPFTTMKGATRSIRPAALVISAGLLAAAPDLDTAFFGVIPYGHFYGHRGFFHSPFFSILFSLVLSSAVFAMSREFSLASGLVLFLVFSLAGASHGVIDAMTNAGFGVMLLYPWSKQRVFLPWRPFHAPPIKLAHLSMEQLRLTLRSELPLMIAISSASVLLTAMLRRLKIQIERPPRGLRFP